MPSFGRHVPKTWPKAAAPAQVGRVNSLSVDHEEQRLYWTDLDANTIESSDLSGERRRVVVGPRAGQRPFGLAQYQEFLYWTDLEGHSIEQALKSTGANRSRLLAPLKYIDDLLVFHNARQAGEPHLSPLLLSLPALFSSCSAPSRAKG